MGTTTGWPAFANSGNMSSTASTGDWWPKGQKRSRRRNERFCISDKEKPANNERLGISDKKKPAKCPNERFCIPEKKKKKTPPKPKKGNFDSKKKKKKKKKK